MRFTKMHGAGNDYVYVNAFEERLPEDLPRLAIAVSDRHKGIGSDGLILIRPSPSPTRGCRCSMPTAAKPRCAATACAAWRNTSMTTASPAGKTLRIETARGILDLRLFTTGGKVTRVRVNMGAPILKAAEIPTRLPGDPPINVPLDVAGREFTVTCVSMGNPHCVTFVDEITDDLVLRVGPRSNATPPFPSG